MRHEMSQGVRLRRGLAASEAAARDLADSLGALVDALARAHALAAGGAYGPELASLLARARQELDTADEKLLALDRHRQRSLFRRAGRIRSGIADLERSVAQRGT